MSDYSYISCEQFAEEPKPAVKSAKKVEKGLKRLIIIASIILAAELIWLFGVSPFIPFSTVEINTFAELGRTEILRIAAINDTSSFMSTNVKDVQELLSANILVESVKVTKRFPDKLSISLYPRKAAAVTLANIQNIQVPIFIDTQGVFFKQGDIHSDLAYLPILSGIESPRLNMRLPAGLIPLVENLSVIENSSPELLAAISEIRIEQKAWEGYELVLFPVHGNTKVRIENNLTEEVLRFMMLILSVFENSSSAPQEIDFRSGMGSYRLKEIVSW